MSDPILRALLSQPWAIEKEEHIHALADIARRSLDTNAVRHLAGDGHQERYGILAAAMGTRLDGAMRATVRDGVAVIPVIGPIFPRANMMTEVSGATSLAVAGYDLRVASASDSVSKTLLVIDSPGGAVSGVGEFAAEVARSSKPVTAYVSFMAASAAYWIASQAKEIVADATALVGSIGVAMVAGHQEVPDASGYRHYDIVSSRAAAKRPDVSTEAGRDLVRASLDDIEAEFIAAVAAGRGVTAAVVARDFGGGDVLGARRAKAVGMIDRIASLDETFARLSGRKAPRLSSSGGRARANLARAIEVKRKKGL